MSERAEFVELLHGAGGRWQTARFVMRRWGHNDRAGVVMRRYADRRAAGGASRGTTFAIGPGEERPPGRLLRREQPVVVRPHRRQAALHQLPHVIAVTAETEPSTGLDHRGHVAVVEPVVAGDAHGTHDRRSYAELHLGAS